MAAHLMTAQPSRVRLAAALVVGAACLGACSALPGPPAPVPSSVLAPVAAPTTPADLSPDGFDDAHRATVRLLSIRCGELATGSGFAIDAHTLVTARHVVGDAREVRVSTYDGHDLTSSGSATAPDADLAIVRTDAPLPASLPLADADPQVGDAVHVVGYPKGDALTVTSGHVTGERKDPLDVNAEPVLVADATVEPGSSGSPVLDDDDAVVGVVYAKGTNDTTFFVPVSTLRAMLDDEDSLVPTTACG